MSTHTLAVIILAAGQGKRMKSAPGKNMPKVMHDLAGLPMIGWLIASVEALAPDKIIVVTGPDMPELQRAVKPHATAVQPVANGTAGAVMAALPELGNFTGDVLVLLGDTPLLTPHTMRQLIAARGTNGEMGISVLGTEVVDPTGYGRLIVTKTGILKKIAEEKDANEKERACTLINTGAFCIEGRRLTRWLKMVDNKNAQKEFYITDLPAIAARDGALSTVCVTPHADEVRGCNTKIDLAALEFSVQQRLRAAHMEAGVTLLDPATTYFNFDTIIGADVVIEPGVFFGPGVEIGDHVRIKAFTHFEGAKVKKNVSIGPFARLRPGAEIGADVKIGNFVEIKKSKIGARSKINHLAYVGDCLMGDDTNFSAGAITVNYDGFQKHQTVIGKGVMIGSNVNLVAPLEIDDGAFIAAGSTVTEDVPADSLSVGREKNEIRKGWAAEFRKRKEAAKKKKKASK